MVYINFYFKELKMNDNIVKGVFDSPDNDVYCKFEYDINTRQFKIFDNNKPTRRHYSYSILIGSKEIRRKWKIK